MPINFAITVGGDKERRPRNWTPPRKPKEATLAKTIAQTELPHPWPKPKPPKKKKQKKKDDGPTAAEITKAYKERGNKRVKYGVWKDLPPIFGKDGV